MVLAVGLVGLARMARLGGRVAQVIWHRLAGAVVTALAHPGRQGGHGGDGRVVGDRHRLRDRVRFDVEHSGFAIEPLLDDASRGRPVLAGNVEYHCLSSHLPALLCDCRVLIVSRVVGVSWAGPGRA